MTVMRIIDNLNFYKNNNIVNIQQIILINKYNNTTIFNLSIFRYKNR